MVYSLRYSRRMSTWGERGLEVHVQAVRASFCPNPYWCSTPGSGTLKRCRKTTWSPFFDTIDHVTPDCASCGRTTLSRTAASRCPGSRTT
ncbi:hypothetical protein VTN96DRAFT_5532 [Rasamsonia emersonii]